MHIPMREKYVDEHAGFWIIFGESETEADVADQTRDIFTNLPKEVAYEVVRLQGEFRDKLYALLCKEQQ